MHEFLVDQKLVVRRPDVGHPNFHTVGPVVDQVAKFHGEILTRTSLFATQVFLSEFPSQSSESGLTGSVETNEMVHPLHSEVTQYDGAAKKCQVQLGMHKQPDTICSSRMMSYGLFQKPIPRAGCLTASTSCYVSSYLLGQFVSRKTVQQGLLSNLCVDWDPSSVLPTAIDKL